VPEGVRFLTAWADAQNNRWEWLVRGWGEGGESWVVHHEAVPGDPAASPAEWDAMLARLAEASFPLADGSGRRMRIRGAGFDSYGQPGVTEQAYAAWLRRRQKGKIRRLGVIEGRDAWDLIPTKGATGRSAPRIQVVYPNSQRKDRRVAARGQVPLLLFNPNSAKDALAAQLVIAPPAAGAVHFPAALRAQAGPPHPFFEGLAAEQRDAASGRWTPTPGATARNEPLDLMVGCELVARLHGLHRINWERPPAWAAPWETNSMIVDAETANAEAVVRLAEAMRPAIAAMAPASTPVGIATPTVAIAGAVARPSLAARLAG
jgi:phage terminase large subunit GpA-like protein